MIKKEMFERNFQENMVLNFNVSSLTSIGTGGKCLYFLKIENRKSLLDTVTKLTENSVKFIVIASGTNILFNDGFLNIAVLKLGKEFNYLQFAKAGKIIAGAACNLLRFIVDCARHGYDFSFLAGIPGTVGGAVMGNSGGNDNSLNNYLQKIRYVAVNKNKVEDKTIEIKNACQYRFFHVADLAVLTDIILLGEKEDRELIFKKIRENIKIKKAKQPLNSKNAGCFFKNIKGCHLRTGEMIDKCGLKNFSYGGARISNKHANFLENHSNASSKDLLILSKIIKYFVKNGFNKELEYEVRMIGF
ncbi:MAG: UDP-N-acetylmuramate dehydrogenase [Actinobacteria bacterium]|nr:UDP-N-acetylmuramate dehydrogenase [Actinomycetota bacterium]